MHKSVPLSEWIERRMGEEIRIRSAKGGEECVEVTSLASLILRVGVLSSWPGPESAQIFSPKKLGDPIFF